MTALAPRPRPALAVYGGDPVDDERALEAALTVRRLARQKGLPQPLKTVTVGGYVEVTLRWPHYLQWVGMLNGLGHAAERQRPDLDPATDNMPEARVVALPHHRRGDYSLHGWTTTEADDGTEHHQQWVLRPVHDPDCRSCGDLPETRQPLSVEAWFHDTWWGLVGKRWDQETGPRAHLVTAGGAR